MNTSLTRSLTVLSLSALAAISTASATNSDKYGTAPASLDFPTSALDKGAKIEVASADLDESANDEAAAKPAPKKKKKKSTTH